METTNRRLSFLMQKLRSLKIPGRVIFVVTGIASTLWFLIRVIPKPQRASYPCMKVAAPVMSGFVIYLTTLLGSVLAFRKAKAKLFQARYLAAVMFALVSVVSAVAFFAVDSKPIFARTNLTIVPPEDGPNAPMGIARGIYPGRVIWDMNPKAIKGDPYSTEDDYHFLAENNDQKAYDAMFKESILRLTGASGVKNAWDSLFRFHNRSKGLGNVSYKSGQKIFIKINQVTAGYTTYSTDCFAYNEGNPASGGTQTTPFVALAMLREMVRDFGVVQSDIYIGDPNSHIFAHNYEAWHSEFPNIRYLDAWESGCGRTPIVPSSGTLIHYSDNGSSLQAGVTGDGLPTIIQQASYVINLANLKPHMRAGVSMTAKNYFGTPSQGCGRLHEALIAPNEGDANPGQITNAGYNKYRVFVDIMGNKYLGKNTMLFIIDAYYGGPYHDQMHPVKYQMPPFNNDWCASLLMSQDEVALESVGFDILRTEFNGVNQGDHISPNWGGVDDYLHQAADSLNWPEGIKYTPNGDGIPIGSLGVHEHWNNATDRQYTKNLHPGGDPEVGIELVSIGSSLTPVHSNIYEAVPEINIYPNPASSVVRFTCNISGDRDVTIQIFDLNGRKLLTMFYGNQGPGVHSYNWDCEGDKVPAGTYLCKMSIGSKVVTGKITVRH